MKHIGPSLPVAHPQGPAEEKTGFVHWAKRTPLASTWRPHGILSISSMCVLGGGGPWDPLSPQDECGLLPKTSLGSTFSKALAINSGV